MAYVYPETKRDIVVDDFHGNKIEEAYRWLEDPDGVDTQKWVQSQNELTQSVLAKCTDRSRLLERLKEVRNYVDMGAPFQQGNHYYYWKNSGLQNQHVLFQMTLDKKDVKVFLDPNQLNAEGTSAVSNYEFSDSGALFAYSIAEAGSDWTTIYFKSIEGEGDHGQVGKKLPDELKYVKFSSIAWTQDEKGVFYCRYPPPKSLEEKSAEEQKLGTEVDANKNQQLYYHRLGTSQTEDRLIYHVPEESEWMYGASMSDDFEYLIITISQSCDKSRRFYLVPWKQQSEGKGLVEPLKLVDVFEAEYSYVTNDKNIFYLYTNKNAPRNKLVKVDIHSDKKEMVDVIPETKDVLQWVRPINHKHFLVSYMQDVKEILQLYDMDGKLVKDFNIPIGQISSIHTKRTYEEFFFKFVSFLSPGTIYHYHFGTDKLSVYYQTEVKGIDLSGMITEQIFYQSNDGTRIPMFIVRKKDIAMDGSNPVLLYGYGGFNISITPSFSVSRLLWIHHYNAILAVANIRGGDEYGEDWHQGGILDRKQNVFDDFKSAARELIKLKYSSPKKICIQGGSNGGLLVAACINQEPELFGVAIAQVGVLDMLRFHKFTIGYAWTSDYGCADKPEEFKYLIKYSPIHNVKKGKEYPALMLLTADHDDRVVPLHSYKYIAEVQHQLAKEDYQKNPLVIRIEAKAGHGAGKPMSKVLEEAADYYAFMAHFSGAQWKD